MAKNFNSSCDNCGVVLYGKDRGAWVKKDNIFFNGQAGKNVFDPETGYHQTVYFTRTSAEQTCFCDATCLTEWMEMQEQLYENRKKARLMDEASYTKTGEYNHTAHSDRPAWSSGPEDSRSKPGGYKKYGTPPADPPSSAPAPAPKKFGYGGEVTEA